MGTEPAFGETLAKNAEKLNKIFTLDGCDFANMEYVLAQDFGVETIGSIRFQTFDSQESMIDAFAVSVEDTQITAVIEGDVISGTNTGEPRTEQVSALSEDVITASGKCGDDLTWTLFQDGTMVISGSGAMWDGAGTTEYDTYKEQIKHIIFEDGVTSIGGYAFNLFTNLETVEFPDTVTRIYGWAFNGCSGLKELVIPDSVTSAGNWAFSSCTSLTDLSIGRGLTEISQGLFSGCTSLTTVVIPDSVTFIGPNAFECCSSLKNVTIPTSVTAIGHSTSQGRSFANCDSLEEIYIPDSVTDIGVETFEFCRNLKNIRLPGQLKEIQISLFYNCTSLETIEIPDGVEIIYLRAFKGCTNLKEIDLPDSVVHIGGQAFYDCSSLTSVVIPKNCNLDGSGGWDYIFNGCTSLTTVTIPVGVTLICTGAFNLCPSITDVYYEGSESQWNEINIEIRNEDLLNATIHFLHSYGSDTYVRYFSRWDEENQIVYFGPGDMVGSQVTAETDANFAANPTALLGQYVLVETKPRTDGVVGPDALIRVEAVESKTGMVNIIGESSITIGLQTYSVPADMVLTDPDDLARNMVLYHLYNGGLIDLEVLETVTGTLTAWDAENRKLTVAFTDSAVDEVTYTLSSLADEDTMNLLADGTVLNTQVSCKVGTNALMYQVDRADNQFEMGTDNLRFLNSETDFFSSEEITQGRIDKLKEATYCLFLQKWAYEKPYERSTPYCYQITDESFNRLTSGMSNTVVGQLVQTRYRYWNGSCFGMSSVAAIRFMDADRMPFERLPGTESPASSYNLADPKDSSAAEDLINFYQLGWNLPIIYRQWGSSFLQINEDYKVALEQIISALNEHGLVLACIKSDDVAHAVLLLRIIQSENDYYDIAVYDPNRTEETTMRLYKLPEANDGCIRIAYSGSQNVDTAQISYDRLYYYCTNVDQIDVKNYFGIYNNLAWADYDRAIFNLVGDANVIWNAPNVSFSYIDGAVESLNNVVGPFTECRETTEGTTAECTSFMTDFQNLSGEVECSIAPKTANGCEMEFIFEGYSLSVDTETSAKITVDPQTANATIETDTLGKIGLLVVQDKTSTQWSWYATAVDIGEAQRVVVSISEDGLRIESDGLDDMSVAVKKDDSFVQKDFSTDAQELNLIDRGDTIQLKDEHEHTYSTPTFTWFNDNTCTATFICVDGDDVKAVDCTVTSTTTPATETATGKTVYTATVDLEGQTYIDTRVVTIPPTNHTAHMADTTWHCDSTSHWHKCTVCGEKMDVTYHSGGAATCTKRAECEICGIAYDDLTPHDYETAWFQAGESGHWHVCKNCSAHDSVVPHVPGAAATATTAQTCTKCGFVIVSANSHTHTADSTWHSNGTYHWHLCTSCGAWVSTSQHSYSSDTDTTCNVCGYIRTIDTAEPTVETEETVAETDEAQISENTTATEALKPTTDDMQENAEVSLSNDGTDNSDSNSSGVSGILIAALVIIMVGSLAGLAALFIYKRRHGTE